MKYIYDSHRILQHFATNHGFDIQHILKMFSEWTGKSMKRVICKPHKIPNNVLNHRKIVHDFQAKYYNYFQPTKTDKNRID